jgi:hypothetical protein
MAVIWASDDWGRTAEHLDAALVARVATGSAKFANADLQHLQNCLQCRQLVGIFTREHGKKSRAGDPNRNDKTAA